MNAAAQLIDYEVGTGRLVPTLAALLGLVSVAGGVLALRARRSGTGRRPRAAVPLATGVAAVVVGGVHAANAAGGPGTGNGVVGAALAVLLGVTGVGLALAGRASRRVAGLGVEHD